VSFPRTNLPASLHAEVADADLVVVPDAPLASTIDRRLDRRT
jgi:hypothetical protein